MSAPQPPIRVLLCDDHAVIRGLVRLMLEDEPGITVVSETSEVAGLVREARRLRPDVVLLDGRLHGLNRSDSIQATLAASPPSRILMFTSEASPAYTRRALSLGAHGYLLKDSAEFLASAIRVVHLGGVYVDERISVSS